MFTVGVFSELPKLFLAFWVGFITQVTLIYFEADRYLDPDQKNISAEEREMLDMLPLLGIRNRVQLIWRVLMPLMLPECFKALYLASASSWGVLVISERSVSLWLPYGIGHQVVAALEDDDLHGVVEYSLLLVLCVIASWVLIRTIKRKSLFWQD